MHLKSPGHFNLKNLLPWSLGVSLCALFLACAGGNPKPPPSDPSLPDVDVLLLKENAEEALKLSQENRLELQTLSARLKELESQMQTLSEQVAAIPIPKIGEHERRLDSLQQKIQAIESRISKGASSASMPKALSTFSTGPIPVDESPKTATSPALLAGTVPAKRVETAKPVSGPEAALYKKAFDLYYARNYLEAIKIFEELKTTFPKGSYADNAEYWIGECHFAVGNYTKAMTAFRKVLEYTETEKNDDAQLKLGYCQLRLGELKAAADEFRKFVSLYPDSEFLERAKNELTKLNAAGF